MHSPGRMARDSTRLERDCRLELLDEKFGGPLVRITGMSRYRFPMRGAAVAT